MKGVSPEHVRHFDQAGEVEGLGGKGANLLRLREAGFPVPDGFCVDAGGYRDFVAANHLAPVLDDIAAQTNLRLPANARAAAARIAERLADAHLPGRLEDGVRTAYRQLRSRCGPELSVAVRSSSLSEDGGQASSAGQYDTYLAIREEDRVLQALLDCYRSLWSQRAIQYRAVKGLDGREEAMAVVVMEMAPAEIAGVTFTLNPLNGNGDEMVLNASWGLGEAVVSGRVTPDNYILAKPGLKLLQSDIGEKLIEVVAGQDTQGTVERAITGDRVCSRTLDAELLHHLGELCLAVEQHFGVPQDIEWAIGGGRIFLLQSRPITALGLGR